MPDEASEIEELQQLFGHSEVPRGMFLKYQVSKQNREIADQGRQRKAELALLNNLVLCCRKAGDTASAIRWSHEQLLLTRRDANSRKILARVAELEQQLTKQGLQEIMRDVYERTGDS